MSRLRVDGGGVEGVRAVDDELLAWHDVIAHQHLEGGLGKQPVVHCHPAQRTVPGIHRRLGELISVHLAKALVTLRLLEVQAALGQLRRFSLVLSVGVGVDVLLLTLASIRQLEAMEWRHRGKDPPDRKSTRLNSSHSQISYAVFCLKKKKH